MSGAGVVRKVVAKFAYIPKEVDELALQKGDLVNVLKEEIFDGWHEGELNGQKGVFPSNFVELQEDEEVARNVVRKAVAKFAYIPKEVDELALQKGDLVNVLKEEIFDGWHEGELNGQKGIFPSNFVELQENEEVARNAKLHQQPGRKGDLINLSLPKKQSQTLKPCAPVEEEKPLPGGYKPANEPPTRVRVQLPLNANRGAYTTASRPLTRVHAQRWGKPGGAQTADRRAPVDHTSVFWTWLDTTYNLLRLFKAAAAVASVGIYLLRWISDYM